MLKQLFEGKWPPLGFFSQTLTSVERRYNVFDWVLLAAYSAVRHFWSGIEGKQCSLFSDHTPLPRLHISLRMPGPQGSNIT